MKNKVQPDIVTTELKKGFEWTTNHSKLVMVVVGALLLVGVAGATYSFVDEKKETALQEKYFHLENDYTKKKEQFDLYESTVNAPVDPKTKKAPSPQGTKASGEMSQDFGPEITKLQEIVNEAPKSKAGVLAAMLLVEIHRDYNKSAEAQEILKKVQGARGTIGIFARAELGSQMANSKDCEGALRVWSDLAKDKAAAFMMPQLKIKMGLCAESLGQTAQAEDYYKQVIADSKESSSAKTAEKYLRLLQSQTTKM